MNRIQIAQIAHTVNAALCLAIGDDSHQPWDQTSEEQRASILAGVDMHLANPEATPEQSHEAWMKAKIEAGWTYAEVKNVEAKQHPCLLPYDQLPLIQRAKDHIFRAVVHQLAGIKTADEVAPAPVPQATDLAVAYVDTSHIPIRYKGHRETHIDAIYGTRLMWARGETKMVPKAAAVQMLRHTDVYEVGPAQIEPAGAVPTLKPTVDKAQEELQDALDQIANLNKAGLASFAKTNFNMDLNLKASLADLRATVTGLVHQYGLG